MWWHQVYLTSYRTLVKWITLKNNHSYMYLNVIHNLSWLNILREGGSLKKLKSVIDAYYSGGVQFQMELDWFVLPFSRLSYAWRSYPAQEHTVPLPTPPLGAMMSSRDHLAWLYSGLTTRPMNKIAPDVLWQIMKRNGWSTQKTIFHNACRGHHDHRCSSSTKALWTHQTYLLLPCLQEYHWVQTAESG